MRPFRLLIVIPMLLLSLAGFTVAGFALSTGKVPPEHTGYHPGSWHRQRPSRSRWLTGEQAPGEYWKVVLLGVGMGVFWLVAAVWTWRRPTQLELIRRKVQSRSRRSRWKVIAHRSGLDGEQRS